jgi:hypothetical protein
MLSGNTTYLQRRDDFFISSACLIDYQEHPLPGMSIVSRASRPLCRVCNKESCKQLSASPHRNFRLPCESLLERELPAYILSASNYKRQEYHDIPTGITLTESAVASIVSYVSRNGPVEPGGVSCALGITSKTASKYLCRFYKQGVFYRAVTIDKRVLYWTQPITQEMMCANPVLAERNTKLVNDYNNGDGIVKLAHRYTMSTSGVYRILKANGVSIRTANKCKRKESKT